MSGAKLPCCVPRRHIVKLNKDAPIKIQIYQLKVKRFPAIKSSLVTHVLT